MFCQVNENSVPKADYDNLKKKYEGVLIELRVSRQCNERLTVKYLKVCEMLKDVSASAATGGMNASQLKDEDQFEIASIGGSQSHDSKFVKTCLFILHDRDSAEIIQLSRTGRRNLVSENMPVKKVEPKKMLIMKNMFCARVRHNSASVHEMNSRIASFEKLVSAGISNLKTQISRKSIC